LLLPSFRRWNKYDTIGVLWVVPDYHLRRDGSSFIRRRR
jgi:hypothetical protein